MINLVKQPYSATSTVKKKSGYIFIVGIATLVSGIVVDIFIGSYLGVEAIRHTLPVSLAVYAKILLSAGLLLVVSRKYQSIDARSGIISSLYGMAIAPIFTFLWPAALITTMLSAILAAMIASVCLLSPLGTKLRDPKTLAATTATGIVLWYVIGLVAIELTRSYLHPF